MSANANRGNVTREQRFFKFKLERSSDLLETAIEDALGVRLTEISFGMWFAKVDVDRWNEIEVIVRALRTDEGTTEGTTVEIVVRHLSKPISFIWLPLVVLSVPLILPFFLFIAVAQRAAREQQRERMVMIHQMWTEIAGALGAPRKGSYRGDARVRARVRDAEEEHVELDEERAPEHSREG